MLILNKISITARLNGKRYLSRTSLMVFGSSTDVGKTIITAGLCRASLTENRKVCYIKPVQTGELDEYFIQLYANPKGFRDIICRTMYHWDMAMSPHLAAEFDGHRVRDDELIKALRNEIRLFENASGDRESMAVVETAGGILTPGPNRTLMADLYRPLRLPVVLIGDAKLGGITTTLSAIESLRLRGYTVHAVGMIQTSNSSMYGNVDFVQEYLDRIFSTIPGDNLEVPKWTNSYSPKAYSLSPLPADRLLHTWFQENDHIFTAMNKQITASIDLERKMQQDMLSDGPKLIWWPFTQHGPKITPTNSTLPAPSSKSPVNFIDHAHGDAYSIIRLSNDPPVVLNTATSTYNVQDSDSSIGSGVDGGAGDRAMSADGRYLYESLTDVSCSWWTQGVGHGNPDMALALAEAAGRYGHVLLPGNLHAPVVQLSRYLINRGPGVGWAERCFYSDNGSTAMEVALKIGLRLGSQRRQERGLPVAEQVVVLGQKGAYHGDTLGMMHLGTPSIYHSTQQHPWYTSKVVALDLPYICYQKGVLVIDASDLPEKVRSVVERVSRRSPSQLSKPTTLLPTMQFNPPAKESVVGLGSLSNLLDIQSRIGSDIEAAYRDHIAQALADCVAKNLTIGALVIEPVMLGAGGFKFVDPLFQRVLVQECRKQGIPVIADEVATGMFRLGPVTAMSGFLEMEPDVAAYGKLLSGGYIPFAATLASGEAFDSFSGNDKASALLHGHSYAGSPIGCAAALEGIRIMENSARFDRNSFYMTGGFIEADLDELSRLPGVASAMGLGNVLAVELLAGLNEEKGYTSNVGSVVAAHMRKEGILARPLGNVVYIMVTPVATSTLVRRLVRVAKRCITRAFYEK